MSCVQLNVRHAFVDGEGKDVVRESKLSLIDLAGYDIPATHDVRHMPGVLPVHELSQSLSTGRGNSS